jgi:signal transduction histidine kinase
LSPKLDDNNNFDWSTIQRLKHDLRNPLNVIIGFSSLLKEEQVGVLNEKQRRYVENIFSSAQTLLSLLSNPAESSADRSADPVRSPQEIQS